MNESDAVIEYLARLQDEAENGFHKKLRAWVDDQSEVARVLTAYAESLEE